VRLLEVANNCFGGGAVTLHRIVVEPCSLTDSEGDIRTSICPSGAGYMMDSISSFVMRR
jgi:hypothetical protein